MPAASGGMNLLVPMGAFPYRIPSHCLTPGAASSMNPVYTPLVVLMVSSWSMVMLEVKAVALWQSVARETSTSDSDSMMKVAGIGN